MTSLTIQLPEWLAAFALQYQPTRDRNTKMQFVIDAARKNIETGSGGPFAAAVFDRKNGELISLGVNLVVSQQLSMLHAEMVALALAERQLGRYNLGAVGKAYELYCSAEPCAMCLGAIPWSGVSHLVVAATDQDVRNTGFDEGVKPRLWEKALVTRGITVDREVMRLQAVEVLQTYFRQGGELYQPDDCGKA